MQEQTLIKDENSKKSISDPFYGDLCIDSKCVRAGLNNRSIVQYFRRPGTCTYFMFPGNSVLLAVDLLSLAPYFLQLGQRPSAFPPVALLSVPYD